MWSRAVPADKKPSHHEIFSSKDTTNSEEEQNKLNIYHITREKAILVDRRNKPLLQSHTSRKPHARGLFLVPKEYTPHCLDIRKVPYYADQIIYPKPRSTRPAHCTLKQIIANALKSLEADFTMDTVNKIKCMTSDIIKDEEAAERNARSHRIRRQSHLHIQHVVIGMEQYTAPVKAKLYVGFTIIFNTNGQE